MSASTELPFLNISPKAFERFCFALLAAEDHTELRHWGDAGNEKGCDIVSVDPEGRRMVTQCKPPSSATSLPSGGSAPRRWIGRGRRRWRRGRP